MSGIPLASSPAVSPERPSAPPRVEGRVLVVDDTEAKRYTVAHPLRTAGMEVVEADCGERALALAELQPDLIVLDVRLPDVSGFEVSRRLKARPATAAIPVLYISAHFHDAQLEARLFEDGTDGYIPQPVDAKHLVAQAWALVRMRRAQVERERLQRELERAQARARQLLESGVVGVFSWDVSGPILEADDTFLAMLGYTREDVALAPLDWRRMTPPEWEAVDAQGLQELEARGACGLLEKQLLRKDGTRVDVMLSGALFEGERHRGATLVVDISARKQAERELARLIAEHQATLESLRVSEERLRQTLEAAALGTWSYDVARDELRWDARCRELCGLPPDVPVNQHLWLEAVHPDDRARVEATARRSALGEERETYEVEYRVVGLRDGGLLRWISDRGRATPGADGRVVRVSGTVADITERKLGEQHAAALQATTAAFAHALTPPQVAQAMVEHGLKALDAYAGAVSVVVGEELRVLSDAGYPESSVGPYRGMPLSLHAPPAHAARTGQAVWVETPEAFERDWPELAPCLRQGRSRSWASIPLKDGERVVGVLGLSFATPRRFSAREKAHLDSLCQLCAQALERARLYEEERRAKEEARRRESQEQHFLGVVSHDLRNPLQAISLAARTLQRLERPTPEALLRISHRISLSADSMGRMISDLLDFTRGRLGGGIPLGRSTQDVLALCREVVDEFSVTHPERELLLEGEPHGEVWWDGARMRQALSNLLSNALRHAHPGTPVRLRAEGTPDGVAVSVTNEGEPLPAELLPVLFEPFGRGSPRFRPSGSLGLGLYIVRQVVEGHGGTVEAASVEGSTTFTVRVPRGMP